jgi:hypothetical protein
MRRRLGHAAFLLTWTRAASGPCAALLFFACSGSDENASANGAAPPTQVLSEPTCHDGALPVALPAVVAVAEGNVPPATGGRAPDGVYDLVRVIAVPDRAGDTLEGAYGPEQIVISGDLLFKSEAGDGRPRTVRRIVRRDGVLEASPVCPSAGPSSMADISITAQGIALSGTRVRSEYARR